MHKVAAGLGKSMIPFALIVFFIWGCEQPNLYDKYIQIDKNGWYFKDQAAFETTIADTLQSVDFYLNIRHNTDYDFRNLYLFLHTQFPSGQITTDTLEIIMATPDGKWIGKGYGSIKEDRVLLKKGVYFPQSGKYIFSLEQAMRRDTLRGIEDVGITITKMGE